MKKWFVFMLIALALAVAMPVAAGPPVASPVTAIQVAAMECIFSGAPFAVIKALPIPSSPLLLPIQPTQAH